MCRLVLGFALVGVVALTLGLSARRLLDRVAANARFGLVPGTGRFEANFRDRRCGVPKSTGVPPLGDWIADRLDDLSGVPDLTSADLDTTPVLMTTDLSGGRPYRLPFTEPADAWLFCRTCPGVVLPRRPTFGLSLQPYPPGDDRDVWLPEQDASTDGAPWRGTGLARHFASAILDALGGLPRGPFDGEPPVDPDLRLTPPE